MKSSTNFIQREVRLQKLKTIGFALAYVALLVLCAMFVAVTRP